MHKFVDKTLPISLDTNQHFWVSMKVQILIVDTKMEMWNLIIMSSLKIEQLFHICKIIFRGFTHNVVSSSKVTV